MLRIHSIPRHGLICYYGLQNFKTVFLFINYSKTASKFTVTSESINIAKPTLNVTVTFAVIN